MNIDNQDFIFKKGTRHIWEALDQIPGTGWVQWGIPDPETVAEHTVSAKELVTEWKEELGLSNEDFFDVLAMIEIHDWPEIITGDVVIMGDEPDFIERKKRKKQNESLAMEEICLTLPEGEKILALYKRYIGAYDQSAILANDIEKIQAVLLAEDYEKRYAKNGLLAEFLKYTRQFVNTDFALDKLQEIAKRNSLEIERV